jgi:hypothetical protein
MDWKQLFAYITGTVDQELLLRNEYLVTENRILRNQISGRLRLTNGERKGCVANFAQEVVKGQLPLSVGRLSGQGVEQFGHSDALVSGLHPHLSFLDHVHELNPNECVLGCLERFKPQHRPCHPLYTSMILFHHIRVVPK